jgi:hypothetical protein
MADNTKVSETKKGTETWPELAEGLYSFLTGRGAVIEYQAENLEIMVPREVGEDAPQARWKVNGTIRIRTEERGR